MYSLCLLNVEGEKKEGASADIIHQRCSYFRAQLLLLGHNETQTLQSDICLYVRMIKQRRRWRSY